jgi:iron complex transport system substrate-binding protein
LAARERVQIVSLHPTRLGEVLADVERVAAAIGRVDEGGRLRRALEERLRAIAARGEDATTRPRVVTVEWLDPLMLGGTWMPELITLAGGAPVGPAAGERAPTVAADGLRALRPEVVLVKPCGFGLDRTLAEAALIERTILDVVAPTTRVYASDGTAFFNRPGPRLVESAEIAAACIHPERFAAEARRHADVIRRLR